METFIPKLVSDFFNEKPTKLKQNIRDITSSVESSPLSTSSHPWQQRKSEVEKVSRKSPILKICHLSLVTKFLFLKARVGLDRSRSNAQQTKDIDLSKM